MSAPLRVVSYGGGVQSTALLVLAAEGRIDFRTFLMANVGDDSEHPATLKYVRDHAMPYAEAHGIDMRLLDRRRRDGTTETLYGRLTREGSRSIDIPVRMGDSGAPGNRSCTGDFKIKVTGRWLRENGAHGGRSCAAHAVPAVCRQHQKPKAKQACRFHPADGCADCRPANRAVVGMGISLDEIVRVNARRVEPHEHLVYPLVGVGEETGLKMNRQDCVNLIERSDLPVPPKSSCFFCPFHTGQQWADMRRNQADLFERSAALEDSLNARRAILGKDPVYLTRAGVPLRDAIENDSHGTLFELDDNGTCDSGWCTT